MCIYTFSQSSQGNLKRTASYILWCINERICLILHTRQNISDRHFITSMSSDTCKFAQWWYWDGVVHKQTNTICKPKRIRLFALIIYWATIMKTKSRFSRNIHAISDRIWCNKHFRYTTMENMITTGKVDACDLIMITVSINISLQLPKLKWAGWTHTIPCIVMTIKGNR